MSAMSQTTFVNESDSVLAERSRRLCGELRRPVPTEPLDVRAATMIDFEFIDELQKMHCDAVGFMQRQALESYIDRGDALIAERDGEPLGYILSRDKYFKREDTGIIYQINVVPDSHRGLIAATLLKEVFDRAPYGVRLYCCWCAQDLTANHFWEAMGFTPLAFRTGSPKRGKKKSGQPRIHIFWERRIREGDHSTPWWFPSETKGGAIGDPRVVIPIPIGSHWSDPMPVILPGEPERVLADESAGTTEKERNARSRAKPTKAATAGRLWFAPTPEEIAAEKAAKKKAKAKHPRKRTKNNAKYVAAARELRDRFLEEVERSPELLDGQATGGKYEVSRALKQNRMSSRFTSMRIS